MDMLKLLREAQQMQARAQALQGELAAAIYEATSGGGAVTATVTGMGELKSVVISPEVVDPSDVGMLQDLVIAAVRSAQEAAAAGREEQLGSLTAALEDLGLPGLDAAGR
jgi:hypothetical protein